MTLAYLKPYLTDADLNGYAIGCFNIINLESIDGVIKAAENLSSPVCITIHPPHFKYTDIGVAAAAVRKASEKTCVPVILHLDNATDISQIVDAVKYGFTSVMFIGKPGMDYKTKVEKTSIASEIAHAAGIMIESDILLKKDTADSVFSDTWKHAYIESAADFCSRTVIDIVSADIVRQDVSNGQKVPAIDLELLAGIKKATGKFISLHGGSGVPDDVLQNAFKSGLNKMHIYGRSADTAISKIKELLGSGSSDLIEIMNEQRKGFRQAVEKSINVFGSAGKSTIMKLVNEITEIILNNLRSS